MRVRMCVSASNNDKSNSHHLAIKYSKKRLVAVVTINGQRHHRPSMTLKYTYVYFWHLQIHRACQCNKWLAIVNVRDRSFIRAFNSGWMWTANDELTHSRRFSLDSTSIRAPCKLKNIKKKIHRKHVWSHKSRPSWARELGSSCLPCLHDMYARIY